MTITQRHFAHSHIHTLDRSPLHGATVTHLLKWRRVAVNSELVISHIPLFHRAQSGGVGSFTCLRVAVSVHGTSVYSLIRRAWGHGVSGNRTPVSGAWSQRANHYTSRDPQSIKYVFCPYLAVRITNVTILNMHGDIENNVQNFLLYMKSRKYIGYNRGAHLK
jgi:hypothetical protein